MLAALVMFHKVVVLLFTLFVGIVDMLVVEELE